MYGEYAQFHQLEQALKEARSYVDQAEWRMGISLRRPPARLWNDLNVVKRENMALARLLAEYQSQAQTGQAGLGIAFIASALIGGAAMAGSALVGWIWKNRAQAEDLEARTSLYGNMIDEGVDPDKAAKLILGQGSSVSDMLDKMIVLSVIGVGAYVFIKLR